MLGLDKKFSMVSEEPGDHSRLELSMESDYGKNQLYLPSFGHDRLTSPDASRFNFSPRAPTPQQMFNTGMAKVSVTG